MAALRFFVSSTCVDLAAHREQIRNLISRMGYEPVMSDFSDVLYDPRRHTHTSCIKEVSHADIVILLIGSRFGGSAVPEAISEIDLEDISSRSTKGDIGEQDKYSITQLEVMKAMELGIPIFTFVDSTVYAEHHTYIKNRDSEISEKIVYGSISKPETARYIFEFISFISHMNSNNAIFPFRNFSDIEDHILKQWSGLFQTLLREARDRAVEGRRAEAIFEQIQDLKAAILQSASVGSGRDIARSVLRYRGLIEFLIEMRIYAPNLDLLNYADSFDDLLSEFGVAAVESVDPANRVGIARLLMQLEDGNWLRVRVSPRRFEAFAVDWNEFSKLDSDTKDAVFQGIADANTFGPSMVIPVVGPIDEEIGQGDLLQEAAMRPEDSKSSGWTEERLNSLVSMWEAGKTASEIADSLGGISRNAVIGKAHRLGLKSRPSPVKPTTQ